MGVLPSRTHRARPRRPARSVRVVLPGLLLLAAVVVAIVGPRDLAPGLVAAAAVVVVADLFIRVAILSQRDRDRESDARQRFRRSGRWPDDDGSAPSDDAAPDSRDPHRRRR